MLGTAGIDLGSTNPSLHVVFAHGGDLEGSPRGRAQEHWAVTLTAARVGWQMPWQLELFSVAWD